MVVNVLNKKLEFRTEVVVVATATLVLLGCLLGYIFTRNGGDIIIESATPTGKLATAADREAAARESGARGQEELGTEAHGRPGGAQGDSVSETGTVAESSGKAAGGVSPGIDERLHDNGNGATPGMQDSGGGSGGGNAAGNAAGAAGLSGGNSGENPTLTLPGYGQPGIASDTSGSRGNAVELIKVYVVGCVNNPGIVTIEKGQLIDDAVRKAGGLTEDADRENINMVYALNGNVMLRILPRESIIAKAQAQKKKSAAASAGGGNSTENTAKSAAGNSGSNNGVGSGAEIIADSGKSAVITGDNNAGEDGGNAGKIENIPEKEKINPVNINTAGIAELDTLPGIGEATAREIISFREKHGRFMKIEDIMKVPRIKQNRFQSIKDYITVD